jgi:hypothetical protein
MMATGRVIRRLSQRPLLIFELHKGERKTVAVGKSLRCFENSQNVKSIQRSVRAATERDFGLRAGAECTRSDRSRHGLNGLTCLNCLNIASSGLPEERYPTWLDEASEVKHI